MRTNSRTVINRVIVTVMVTVMVMVVDGQVGIVVGIDGWMAIGTLVIATATPGVHLPQVNSHDKSLAVRPCGIAVVRVWTRSFVFMCSKCWFNIKCYLLHCLLPCADDRPYRTFFHSPQMGARAVVDIGDYMPTDTLTLCMWLRSSDNFGGLVTYSTPTSGLEWSVRVGDVGSGDTRQACDCTAWRDENDCSIDVLLIVVAFGFLFPSNVWIEANSGESSSTVVQPFDGLWHFFCTSWTASTATATLSVDVDQSVDSVVIVGSGSGSFDRGGCLMFGQLGADSDTTCTQLRNEYSYEGYMTDVTLWSTILSTTDVGLFVLFCCPARIY